MMQCCSSSATADFQEIMIRSLTPLAHMLKCKVFSCIRTDSTFSATIKSFLTLRQFSVTCRESFKVESGCVKEGKQPEV